MKDVPVTYTGVGANAASVLITSAPDTVVAGQGFSYVAEARDPFPYSDGAAAEAHVGRVIREARDIATGWVKAGVQAPPWALYQWFRWSGQAKRIRAGITRYRAWARHQDSELASQVLGQIFRNYLLELQSGDNLSPFAPQP